MLFPHRTTMIIFKRGNRCSEDELSPPRRVVGHVFYCILILLRYPRFKRQQRRLATDRRQRNSSTRRASATVRQRLSRWAALEAISIKALCKNGDIRVVFKFKLSPSSRIGQATKWTVVAGDLRLNLSRTFCHVLPRLIKTQKETRRWGIVYRCESGCDHATYFQESPPRVDRTCVSHVNGAKGCQRAWV